MKHVLAPGTTGLALIASCAFSWLSASSAFANAGPDARSARRRALFRDRVAAAEGRRYLSSGWRMQDAGLVPEPGEVISTPAYVPDHWYVATVPGTVLTTLVNQGVYPEPLYGLNNLRIPESLNKTRYWYRTCFDLSPEDQGQVVWLHFDGVNHSAQIFLNGTHLGEIRGAFKRARFDVTSQARVGTPNCLAVEVTPPPHPGVPHEQTLADAGHNGGDIGRDSPTFVATVGWDWIPGIRDRDSGLWRGVYLRTTGPVVLENPQVETRVALPAGGRADVAITAEVHNTSAEPERGVVQARLDGHVLEAHVDLAPFETRAVTLDHASHPVLRISNPQLWWPNGYGKQSLYPLDLRFVRAGAAISDHTLLRFGIRDIAYAAGTPEAPELQIRVNGQPILAVGGNWGMDEAMKREDRRRLAAQIRFHKEAHLTMIRNWVGMTDDDAFYDLCDENGILIWDEFWLANPVDGPDPDEPAVFLDNARDKILRYRNHPSIALWCARNEGFAPDAIAPGLASTLKALDPSRRFQGSSADAGVHGHGPYAYQEPEAYFGLAHGFTTEIGLPSIPPVESVRAMMPEGDLWPPNDTWGYHDYTGGACHAADYTRHMTTRYGAPTGVEDFCRKGQMMNYEAFRAIFEGWNRKLWHDTSGLLLWMSNPAQPSFVWQLYDYYLEPNASFFAVKKACEPLHIQLNLDDASVSVVNHGLKPVAGLLARARLIDLDGAERHAWTAAVQVAADSATTAMQLPMTTGMPDVYFVKLELLDGSGAVLSDNFYWRSDSVRDFAALGRLPSVQLNGSAALRRVRGEAEIEATVENPSRAVALEVRLSLRKQASGARVLPTFYEDNYFSLLPGEVRRVRLRFDPSDLGGDAPDLRVEGWNVLPGTLPIAAGKGAKTGATGRN